MTNELWKSFYEKQYGAKNLSFVMEKMERSKVNFKWRELYEVGFVSRCNYIIIRFEILKDIGFWLVACRRS